MLALEQKYGDVPVVGSALRAAGASFHAPSGHQRSDARAADEDRRRFRASRCFLRNPPPIQIGGDVTESPYQLTLQSPDTEELYRVATDFEQQMADPAEAFRM